MVDVTATSMMVCDAIASGVTSLGGTMTVWVVDENAPATLPMVNVVVTVLAPLAALVWRTQTLWPGCSVPEVVVNTPLQPME